MTIRIYILLIILLGFFMAPTISYACGKSHSETEQSGCDNNTSELDKEDCCKTKHAQSNHDDGDCGDKCGDSSCHCSAHSFSCALTYASETKLDLFVVSDKQHLHYTNLYISSGYHSIWQPPKIG